MCRRQRGLHQGELKKRGSCPPNSLLALTFGYCLCSILEAREAEVLRLQEEAEVASRSHQARLSELQESFRKKIMELRRVHEEQLALSQRQAESS
jgi:hypothetical protein